MSLPVKRWFALALLTTAIALARTVAFAADDWEIVKINGHDYLSVDNVSRFYGLPAEVASTGRVPVETVKNPLTARAVGYASRSSSRTENFWSRART